MGIDHDSSGRHFATFNPSSMQRDAVNSPSCGGAIRPDQMDILKSFKPLATPLTERLAVNAVIEVHAVYDKVHASDLGNSQANITSYSAIMFHMVNNIFASMEDPLLSVKLAGVSVLVSIL